MTTSVELRAGALRLALRPDLGGSIAGLWHGGIPVMRSTEPAALDGARSSSSFPMLPYSNRLGHRRFSWLGREYTTQANFNDSPHSLHGVAWLRAWTVASSGEREAVLRYEHQPDEHWPFAFIVRQHFSLAPDRLEVRLVFTNTDPLVQPVGLGWHPYFPKRERSRLDIEVSSRWERDPALLPTHTIAQPGLHAAVAELDVDHCYSGWNGTAQIRDEMFSLQLSASSLPHLVVYTPPEKDYFCVEPVSHVNNAIQMDDPATHGLLALPPGETTEVTMTLTVAAL